MFGGINFKQLSERFNESLHDLESTLSQAAALPAAGNASTSGSQPNSPARQQPARAATSPVASTSSPSRSRPPRPSIETQQARSSQSPSSIKTPLSPTSLAQASQSASQLADSALSSLRASLRKGRQSLETAAGAGRASLDGQSGSATSAAPPKSPAGDRTSAKPSTEPVKEAGGGPIDKPSEEADRRVETAPEAKATAKPDLLVDVSTDEAGVAEPTQATEAARNAASPKVTAADTAPMEKLAARADNAATEGDLDTLMASAETTEAAKDDPDASQTIDLLSPSPPPPLAAASVPAPEIATALSPPASLLASQEADVGDQAPASGPEAEAGDDDDADDWGMGSISPAPESEPAIDAVTEEPATAPAQPEAAQATETTGDATSDVVEEKPAVADEATESTVSTSIAPSDPLRAAIVPDELSKEADAATASLDDLVSTTENKEAEQDLPIAQKEEPLVSLDDSDEPSERLQSTANDKYNGKEVTQTAAAPEPASETSSATLAAIPDEEVAVVAADETVSSLDIAVAPAAPEPASSHIGGPADALPASDAGLAVEDAVSASKDPAHPASSGQPPASVAETSYETDATRAAPPSLNAAELAADSSAAPSAASENVDEPASTSVPAVSTAEPVELDIEPTVNEEAVSSVPLSAVSTEPITSTSDSTTERSGVILVAEPTGEPLATKVTTLPSEAAEVQPPNKSAPPPPVSEVAPTASETKGVADAEPERDLDAVTEPAAPSLTATDTSPASNIPDPAQSAVDAKTVELNVAKAAELPSQLKTELVRILAAVTPLSDLEDLDAVERELSNLKTKADMGAQEIARLTSQLDRRKAAFEELRETHRLEHKSQQDEIEELRAQLAVKDKRLASAESAAEETRKDVAKAAQEYDKLKIVAKEEEEKRVKALSLLRALRQKLVKNEKEKEEADKVLENTRATEAQAQETIKADRARFDSEIVALRGAQEQQVNKLKQSFERETTNLKAQYDREAAARRGQAELDTITLRAEHAKELAARDARIQQLESTVRELSTARDSTFEQLQERQAEAEASSSIQEALKTRAAELEYEANDARDRVTALQEELEDLRRRRVDATRDENAIRRLLEEAEERHSTRVRELEGRARQLEKDRRETEDEMGRNLQDRLREVERLRAALAKKDVDYAESVQNTEKRDKEIEAAHKARIDLEKRLKAVETSLETLREETVRAQQAEAAAKEELSDRLQRATELEARLEEVSTRESTLRSNNRTLRDELRKLQSGVLNSEKQRPAGVGYFSTMSQASSSGLTRSSPSSTSIASMSTIGGGPLSPTLSATSVTSPPASISSTINSRSSGLSATARPDGTAEEALSYEYLRNVILQFLEKPEMRAHLVQVLSVILRFTPAEQRRLAAKSATQ